VADREPSSKLSTPRPRLHPRMVAVLLLLVLVSAIGAVYAKHQTRKLFVELQGLQKARDDMDIEWGQLQLEQSTWATHGRIEDTANAKLGMVIPEPSEVMVLKP